MLLSVREYAVLRLAPSARAHSLDYAEVDRETFDALKWLLQGADDDPPGDPVLSFGIDRSGEYLKVGSHVGLIQCGGTLIEILPKTTTRADDTAAARKVLLKMISAVFGLKVREVGEADLSSASTPISELLMRLFLRAVEAVAREGLAHSYSTVLEVSPVYRGRIVFPEQIKQLPGRRPVFAKELDRWLPDNPQNRVVKASLQRVARLSPSLARLSGNLLELFQDVADSAQPLQELSGWQATRSRGYAAVRPFCELILRLRGASASPGRVRQSSLLFPMPYLFERYLARKLSAANWRVIPQVQDRSLASMNGKRYFPLRPDYLARREERLVVLDAKWKLPSLRPLGGVRGVASPDIYQALAYSEAYKSRGSQPPVALVYPRTAELREHRGPFTFPSGGSLMVVPFDLEQDVLTLGLDEICSAVSTA